MNRLDLQQFGGRGSGSGGGKAPTFAEITAQEKKVSAAQGAYTRAQRELRKAEGALAMLEKDAPESMQQKYNRQWHNAYTRLNETADRLRGEESKLEDMRNQAMKRERKRGRSSGAAPLF